MKNLQIIQGVYGAGYIPSFGFLYYRETLDSFSDKRPLSPSDKASIGVYNGIKAASLAIFWPVSVPPLFL